MAGNSIKIFLSSPGDVAPERLRMADLVAEINDVLAYLVPERGLKLELLRYEVDAYPDYGPPQDVVNRLLSDDYDIFVGIIWKRCGTPTATADSGTIEEYRRAVERRKATGRPIIMFYLCGAAVPFPTPSDIEQLKKAVAFREEVQTQGLTQFYPSADQFREFVRGDLLKAIRDLTQHLHTVGPNESTTPPTPSEMAAILELCATYDKARQEMPWGPARTSKMSEIFANMRALAASVRAGYANLKSSASPGERLAAIAILRMFPDANELEWLSQRLDPDREKAFVGYQAAQALFQAARSLPASECQKLTAAIALALALANRDPDDPPRIRILEEATAYLKTKCTNDPATP